MKVSIVIPNYNGANLLKNNVPQILESAKYYKQKNGSEVEIIIIDDYSTDSSISEIESFKQDVKLLKNEKNLGFGVSVNRGVDTAKGEIVVLLNTDVIPEKDFLLPLIEHFKDEKVFAVGCIDKSVENGKIVFRGRGIGRWQRGFFIHSRGEVNKTNTLWVNGGSGAFRKSIWQKLCGFNDLYSPFYWEDIDLSYRALKSGYKIIFESKSIVIHEHEKGAIKSKYQPFQIKTISYRNQFIFIWKNITDLDLKLSNIFWLPYHLLKSIAGGDLAFIFGLLQSFILLPNIVKSSFKEKKSFEKKDKEILKNFIS